MPVAWDEFFGKEENKRRRLKDMSFQCTTCGEVVNEVYDITEDTDKSGLNHFEYTCTKDHYSHFWLRVPDQMKEMLYVREE